MVEQLPLPGFERAVPPGLPLKPSKALTERYFFAAPVPLEVRPSVAALTRDLAAEHGLVGRPIAPDHLHVTMFHLGDFALQQPEWVATARKFAANIRAKPFTVRFDRTESWPRNGRKNPLVLTGEGANGLIGLHDRFRIPLVETGAMEPAARKFTPHVTLMYDYGMVPERPVTPIQWTVKEFVLVHSLLGQARHIVLGKWRLRG